MKIAFSSQNRKDITGHAGQCRRFRIFEVEGQSVVADSFVELPADQTFHSSHHAWPQALEGVRVLVTGGMGQGLRHRLAAQGVRAVVTAETSPERALAALLAGKLEDQGVAPVSGSGCHDEGSACGCGHRH